MRRPTLAGLALAVALVALVALAAELVAVPPSSATPSPVPSPHRAAAAVSNPSEADLLARRAALTAAAPAAERAARAAAGPTFAGLAITIPGGRAGPVLMVQVADRAARRAAVARAVRAAVGPQFAAAVSVRRADHALAVLDRLHAALRRRVRAAERLALGDASAGSAVDLLANQVVVWASGPPAPLRRALGPLARHPAVRIEAWAGPVGDELDKDDPMPFGLVIAGQRLDLPEAECSTFLFLGSCDAAACSSGFAVRSPLYGPFLLTAGHCADPEDVVHQGGAPVGPVAVRHRGGRFDVALIANRYRTQVGRVHITSDTDFAPVHFAIARGGDPVGASVCHAGYATNGLDGTADPGGRCGVIRYRRYAPPDRLCPDAPCRPVFRLVDYGHRRGDSGAAVYWDTPYGRAAVGLHKGSGPDGLGVYSHLPFVLRTYGLRLSRP